MVRFSCRHVVILSYCHTSTVQHQSSHVISVTVLYSNSECHDAKGDFMNIAQIKVWRVSALLYVAYYLYALHRYHRTALPFYHTLLRRSVAALLH